MKIVKGYPPNFEAIQIALNPPETAVYPFGDTIYNPKGTTLEEDIIKHEEVHERQQGNNPLEWWERYILDKDFRLAQEIEAFGEQFLFLKKYLPARVQKEVINEFSTQLVRDYKVDITIHEAESKIRNYAKTLEKNK